MNPEPNPVPESRPGAAEPGLAALVGGIVHDVQKLVGQHLDFFLNEVREDFRKTKEAACVVGLSVGVAAVGAVLLVVMLIGLLASTVPAVPWWGWCGVVGAVLLVAAVLMYWVGRRMFAAFNPLPDESAAAVKESLGWKKDEMSPDRK